MMFPLLITLQILSSIDCQSTAQRYPIFWDRAPSSLSEYPLTTSGCSSANQSDSCPLIDPWKYLDRLGLYKILIDSTSPWMPFVSSSSNISNILFGLPCQFSWQFQSNRLFSNGTNEVSSNSWWASANYYLSVIPFLAAVDTGLISSRRFRLLPREGFCSTIDQCFAQIPEAMFRWRSFFLGLLRTDSCRTGSMNERVIDRCYLAPLWAAHIATIQNALPLIASKVSQLPSINEQRFGLGWAHLVDFIGKSRKNTNLLETFKYQDEFLPPRMLTDADHPPHAPDFSEDVNRALQLLFFIRDQWYPRLTRIWKQATCNFEARLEAQKVLETMAKSLPDAVDHFGRARVKSMLFPCDAR